MRALLGWVIVSSAGPLLLLAAWLAVDHVRTLRAEIAGRAERVAGALAMSVDRSVLARTRGLLMLASAGAGDDPAQRPALYRQAQGYLRAFEAHVVLADTAGRMQFNTRLPLGAPMPPLPRPQGRAALPLALERGEPVVGDGFLGPVARVTLVAVAVPEIRNGRATAVWLAPFEASQLQPLLDNLALPEGWAAAVRDSTGLLLAARGVPSAAGGADPGDGSVRAVAQTGQAPWTVVVEAPASAVDAPVQRAAAAMGLALLLAVSTGLLGSTLLSRRIERSLRSLVQDGAQDGGQDGDAGRAPARQIAEVAAVRRRLDDAAIARDRATERLREGEESYRLLFESHPHPMWVFDVATLRFLAVNEAAVQHYGYSRDEFMAMTIADIRPPAERERLKSQLAGERGKGPESPWSAGRWIHVCHDGRLIDVEITWSQLRFQGQAARLALAIDVTRRLEIERQREAALQDAVHARDVLRETLARVDDGFLSIDRQGVFSYANPRAAALLGLAGPEALIGHRIADTFPERGDGDFSRAYKAARRSGQPAVLDDFFEPMRRWFEVRLYPSADGMTIYFSDVTERREAEQALRSAEVYQRRLFEALADGVLLLDAEHRVLDANPAAAALLGHVPEALPGMALQDLLAEGERSRVGAVVADLRAEGRPRLAEWEHQRADGSRFPAEVSARAVGPGRTVMVLRDVTERRKAQRAQVAYQLELSELTQRLLTQERETSRHLAQTLHDHLGQSLAVARLHLDVTAAAAGGGSLPAPLQRACTAVAGAVDQAIADVRQLLGDLRPTLLEERGLVAALDNEVRSRAFNGGTCDVLLEVDDAAQAARWPADVEYGAFMVAREAIVNAQRHAQASLVRVILGGGDSHLQLAVVDDGVGIPEGLRQGRPGHLGLVGMRERALAIGARFGVEKATQGGTTVSMDWQEVAR